MRHKVSRIDTVISCRMNYYKRMLTRIKCILGTMFAKWEVEFMYKAICLTQVEGGKPNNMFLPITIIQRSTHHPDDAEYFRFIWPRFTNIWTRTNAQCQTSTSNSWRRRFDSKSEDDVRCAVTGKECEQLGDLCIKLTGARKALGLISLSDGSGSQVPGYTSFVG